MAAGHGDKPWAVFERLSRRYDAWYEGPVGRKAFPFEVKVLRRLLSPLPPPWIEIGVGTGRFAQALSVPFGLDPAWAPLKLAQKRGISVVQGQAEALPLRTGHFGAALFVVTLCFVQDPLAALREAHRILRPDGGLVAGMVFEDSPWGRYYRGKGRTGHPFYRHARFLRYDAFLKLLEKAGFQVEGVFSTLFGPPDVPPPEETPILPGFHPEAGFVALQACPRA